jgi:hypothetical protein
MFVLRDDGHICGYVVIMFPGQITYGQAFDHLWMLKQTGLNPPLVLLTNYNVWIMCTLPEYVAEMSAIAWDHAALRVSYDGGLRLEGVDPESEVATALGLPEYPISSCARSSSPSSTVVQLEEPSCPRVLSATSPVSVEDREKLLQLVGGFLMRCFLAGTSKVPLAILDSIWKKVSDEKPLQLRPTSPNREFLPVRDLLCCEGRDGMAIVVCDEFGQVLVEKSHHEHNRGRVKRELRMWSLLHGPLLNGVPSALSSGEGRDVRLVMPYLHTIWHTSLEDDEVLGHALGCSGADLKQRVHEIVDEELQRVANSGVRNEDARIANMGFFMHSETRTVKAAMLDFVDAKVFKGSKASFGKWKAEALERMRMHLRGSLPASESIGWKKADEEATDAIVGAASADTVASVSTDASSSDMDADEASTNASAPSTRSGGASVGGVILNDLMSLSVSASDEHGLTDTTVMSKSSDGEAAKMGAVSVTSSKSGSGPNVQLQ